MIFLAVKVSNASMGDVGVDVDIVLRDWRNEGKRRRGDGEGTGRRRL